MNKKSTLVQNSLAAAATNALPQTVLHIGGTSKRASPTRAEVVGMSLEPRKKGSHSYWSPEARLLVSNYVDAIRNHRIEEPAQRSEAQSLIAKLTRLTGNSRQACWRFVRLNGVNKQTAYKEWTRSDQQRLLNLIAIHPPVEVAKLMRRSPGSVRAMLHRLGASAQMGRDWFTIYTLSEALHVRAVEVQRWIQHGWLRAQTVQTGRLKKEIIYAEDFADFCKRYRALVVGHRLNTDRLDFVHNFVFPPSHAELLPVRESKKERAAFDALIAERKLARGTESDDTASDAAIA